MTADPNSPTPTWTRRPRPDVSVIVPVYNADRYLALCLDSVLIHSDVSLEIICVNDGSTDSSTQILRRYADLFDVVTVIDQANAGLSGARNTGLAAARGRWVCFLDSDDFWHSLDVAALMRQAHDDDLDVLAYDAAPFRDPGVTAEQWAVYADYYHRSREYGNPVEGVRLLADLRQHGDYRVSACLYFVKLDLLREIGLTFTLGMMHEDNPFTFDVLLHSRRAAHRHVELYGRRVRADSTMTASSVERSASGYLRSHLLMQRSLDSWSGDDPEVAAHLGWEVYQVLVNARAQLTKGSDANPLDTIRGLERDPHAHVAALLLARLH